MPAIHEMTATAKAIYDPDGSLKLRNLAMTFAADQMMVEPSRFIVKTLIAAGQPAYEFRFSYVAESMRKQWAGAPHATEIPFVFDTVSARYGKDLAEADKAERSRIVRVAEVQPLVGQTDGLRAHRSGGESRSVERSSRPDREARAGQVSWQIGGALMRRLAVL